MNPKEFLRAWREGGNEESLASIVPSSANDDKRTVDVLYYSGAPVDRYDYWTDTAYVLNFEPGGGDLSKLNSGAPVLDNHSSYSISDQVGKVLKATSEDGKHYATLQFSRRPAVDGLWQDIKDGIVSKLSMGVQLTQTTEQRNKDGKLTSKTAVKWQPYELSFVPIPADFGTQTLSDNRGKEKPAEVLAALARARQIQLLRLGVVPRLGGRK